MKKKFLSIVLIIVFAISVPFAFCLSSSAVYEDWPNVSTKSTLDMTDMYLGEEVLYRLYNPHFEIFNQNTLTVEWSGDEGSGDAEHLGFYFKNEYHTDNVVLTLSDTYFGEYSASNYIYYRFSFDVRVLWTPSQLRNKYNLDLLVYTDDGGCVMTKSQTFSYVQFLEGETVEGENDEFYYTNLETSAYTPPLSSFNMRLFRVAPNFLRFTITTRMLEGIPKYYRSIGIQFAINTAEAANSYIPKVNLNVYDDIYENEEVLFNRVNGDVTQYLHDIFDDGLVKNSIARYGLAGVTLIFNNFIVPNSYCMYIIYFSMAIGAIPFILLISRTLITNSRKKE